jgi:hypothetical protein
MTRADQVHHRLVGFHDDLGARRDSQLERLAVLAMPQRTLPMAAASSLELGRAPISLQVTLRVVAHQDHVTAAATIPAVRSALRHVCLPAEAQAAVSAGTGAYVYPCSILHLK